MNLTRPTPENIASFIGGVVILIALIFLLITFLGCTTDTASHTKPTKRWRADGWEAK